MKKNENTKDRFQDVKDAIETKHNECVEDCTREARSMAEARNFVSDGETILLKKRLHAIYSGILQLVFEGYNVIIAGLSGFTEQKKFNEYLLEFDGKMKHVQALINEKEREVKRNLDQKLGLLDYVTLVAWIVFIAITVMTEFILDSIGMQSYGFSEWAVQYIAWSVVVARFAGGIWLKFLWTLTWKKVVKRALTLLTVLAIVAISYGLGEARQTAMEANGYDGLSTSPLIYMFFSLLVFSTTTFGIYQLAVVLGKVRSHMRRAGLEGELLDLQDQKEAIKREKDAKEAELKENQITQLQIMADFERLKSHVNILYKQAYQKHVNVYLTFKHHDGNIPDYLLDDTLPPLDAPMDPTPSYYANGQADTGTGSGPARERARLQ